MGRPPAQRHTLKIDLPEDFLGSLGGETLSEGIPKWRIAGAVGAGIGAFLLVRAFQKSAGGAVRAVGGLLEGVFIPESPAFGDGEQEALIAAEPFAVAAAFLTGGMVLAGQNPGEIVKGIGEIIPL